MSVTNVFNNKKYAFIKDSQIIDILLLDKEDAEILEQVKNNLTADSYIEVTNIEHIGVNCYYINGEFTTAKPAEYVSWQWDSVDKMWKAPSPLPADGTYTWNESLLQWVAV